MPNAFGAFISARAHGMKSGLMSRAEIESLIDRGASDGLAEALLSTRYDKEIAEALTRYKGVDAVEDAASRNLVNTFARLRGLARGPYADLVDIFLARWDLVAVKSLLRIRHHEIDAESGQHLFLPGPSMPVALMKELAAQPTMEALVRALVAWAPRMCRPLAEMLPDYQKARDLRVLEEALDRKYFAGNVGRLGGFRDPSAKFLQQLLRMEIDRINLRILLEPRSAEGVAEDLTQRFLPRGRISASVLREAGSGARERVIEALERSAYGDLVEEARAAVAAGQYARLDRIFESAFLARLKRAAQQNGIGIAVLMRYAWLKYNEVINLRMIARASDINLPKDRIRQEMMYV
ncbi:MAG: V-type ATPase subunit [Candidatus Hydrogenedentota bacterium]